MVSTRIIYTKSQIKKVLADIYKTKKEDFRFLTRREDFAKDPFCFFNQVGIDYDDAINIIKSLTVEDYKYTQYDMYGKYEYMYIFHKQVLNLIAYIKIGFKSDKTVVISFHEKMFEE